MGKIFVTEYGAKNYNLLNEKFNMKYVITYTLKKLTRIYSVFIFEFFEYDAKASA